MDANHAKVSGWFLGPRAENFDLLKKYFSKALEDQVQARKNYSIADPISISADIQASQPFTDQIQKLELRMNDISTVLSKYSVPFWSPRYNAHMLMENSFPAVIGYIMAMLYNQNNVATEASPITTLMEEFVGQQLCLMFGFSIANPMLNPADPKSNAPKDDDTPTLPDAWGHITCDGSVANLESIWASRNLKFYPFSLKMAIQNSGGLLQFLSQVTPPFTIETCNGTSKEFLQCSDWELLNLTVPTVLGLPDQLYTQYGISQTFLQSALDPFLVQTLGMDTMLSSLSVKTQPRIFVGTTRHYSWPKGAAIVGIGRDNVFPVPVDLDARMSTEELRSMLNDCVTNQIPVYTVVAIMGSTEQGAIDPLDEIANIREEFQQRGLSFVIHADGAWGGYFASMLQQNPSLVIGPNDPAEFVPEAPLSAYVIAQIRAFARADSVTIDPHKSGYCPYPAGGLCYRDGRMRYLNTWISPIVFRAGDAAENIGVYGVEGSKPGAAAVSAFLSHDVIGLHSGGYGLLLGEALFSCTRLYTNWATMTMNQDTPLIVVPLTMLPSERVDNPNPTDIKNEKQKIVDLIVSKSNSEIRLLPEAWSLFMELGGDVMINAFACNFMIDGVPNTDVVEANQLNTRIFNRTSLSSTNGGGEIVMPEFFLTSSVLSQDDYGACLNKFKSRMGLSGPQDLYVLVNVTMSPWATTGAQSILNDMLGDFKRIAEEEVQTSVDRNTVTPQKHDFVMQGTDTLYLVHLPKFQLASHRYQLVMTGTLESAVMEQYAALRKQSPNDYWLLENATDAKLDDLTAPGAQIAINVFKGSDTTQAPVLQSTLTLGEVIVKKSLLGGDLDPTFPSQMPFNLYGTSQQQHIEHMLLCAPTASWNQQLNSDQVTLSLNNALTETDLAAGVCAVFNTVFEQAMQPMQISPDQESHSQFVVAGVFSFKAGQAFPISVYKSYDDAKAGQNQLSSGTLTLGSSCYTDNVDIVSTTVPPSVLPSATQKHGLSKTPFSSPLPSLPNEIPSAGSSIEYLNKRRALAIKPIRDELVRRLNKQTNVNEDQASQVATSVL